MMLQGAADAPLPLRLLVDLLGEGRTRGRGEEGGRERDGRGEKTEAPASPENGPNRREGHAAPPAGPASRRARGRRAIPDGPSLRRRATGPRREL